MTHVIEVHHRRRGATVICRVCGVIGLTTMGPAYEGLIVAGHRERHPEVRRP